MPAPASSTSDSARSTGRTRRSTPRRRSPRPAATGASSASRRARPTWSTRSPRRTGSTASTVGVGHGRRTRVVGALAGVRARGRRPGRGRRPARRPGDPGGHADRHREGLPARPGDRPAAIDDELRADLATDRPPRPCPACWSAACRPRRPTPARSRWSAATTCRPTGAALRGAGRQALRVPAATGRPRLGTRQRDVPRHHGRPDRARRPPPPTLADGRARRSASRDLAAVAAEPYRQWVIEDDFPGGRPAWERAGAVLTDDVGPWERLKLRTLNGVHSRAGLPRRAGRRGRRSPRRWSMPGMRDAAAPAASPRTSRPASRRRRASPSSTYGDSVLERFANPAIAPPHACRWRWTARRSCRSGCCTRSLDRRAAGAVAALGGAGGRGVDAVRRRAPPTTAGRCRWTTRWPTGSGRRWPPCRTPRGWSTRCSA